MCRDKRMVMHTHSKAKAYTTMQASIKCLIQFMLEINLCCFVVAFVFVVVSCVFVFVIVCFS